MPNQFRRQLLPASFRGVAFGVRSESVTEKGNKLVLHEYPNSNVRSVESLGQIPPKFSIDAFVFGNNWKVDSINLQSALDDPSIGRLVLPVLGAVNVYALPYSLTSSQQRLGEITFRLSFAAGTSELAQPESPETEESVFDAADDIRNSLQDEVEKQWEIPTVNSNSLVAQYDINSLIDKVSNQVSSVVETTEEITEKAESIKRQVSQLTRNSTALAATLFAVKEVPASFFQAISNSLNRTINNIGNIFTLVGFGSELSTSLPYIATEPEIPLIDDLTPTPDIALWPETTQTRILRNSNRLLLVNATRIASLTMAYEQASSSDYLTKQEVQDIRSQLESVYQVIILDSYVDPDTLQAFESLRRGLDIIRQRALAVLAIKEQQAYNIETREILGKMSPPILTYLLYAEDIQIGAIFEERILRLRNLNLNLPALELQRNVDVFSKDQ